MQTFTKQERLCDYKTIAKLFKEGSSFYIYPIKVTWIPCKLDSPYPAQVLINAQRRGFRNSVDRNRIKRQMREAYRKHKSILYDYLHQHDKQCVFSMSYAGETRISFQKLVTIIIIILHRLISEYEGTVG